MKFSVIIPCYNAELWIVGALESVIHQTLPPYEVLVIDDGSNDRSLDLIKAFPKQSFPIVLLQSDRQGPAAARNAGITVAKGDWIAFLDADDWWQPNHLERICAAVETSGDVVYLAAAEHFSIAANRVVSRSDSPFRTLQQAIDCETYFWLYQKHKLLELSSAAVSRQRLNEIGGFRKEFQGAEDFEFIMRAVCDRTLSYDPVPSSYRCGNPESYSRKFALNPDCLTASFRSLLSLQDCYTMPDIFLNGRAKTVASKSMFFQDFSTRQKVLDLAWPYLSKSQQIIFAIAPYFPNFYRLLNAFRNKIRGPQYSPRQVV